MANPPISGQAVGAPSARVTAPGWQRWLIRVRAYFLKEVNEIRRQPLLILSLIVGPLLVLILFGATYATSTPRVRTVVVVSEGGAGMSEEQIRQTLGTNFTITAITTDRASAEAQLAAGQIDLIQVLPGNALSTLQSGGNPQIEFKSNATSPVDEGWIQYLAYAQVNEVNKAILRDTAAQAQDRATVIRARLVGADGQVQELEQGISAARKEATRENLRGTVQALDTLEAALPPQQVLAAQGGELAGVRERIARLRGNLQSLEQAVADDTLGQKLAEITQTRDDLRSLNSSLEIFVSTPPDRLVSPVTQTYSNIRGSAYQAVQYYAPGVLALLVQHTAITLGALALVRERLMGAFEVFRVAPVSLPQMIIGKYLGYTVFIALATLALIVAMVLLGVPLLGSWLQFAGVILLLIVASLGVGFLISTLSGSDSQAIQLAMISLLMSIFFSGFFIALPSFLPAALPVAYSIPMTHGLAAFQNIMLRGLPPDPWNIFGLVAIAVVTFILVVLLTKRQLAKA